MTGQIVNNYAPNEETLDSICHFDMLQKGVICYVRKKDFNTPPVRKEQ